MKSITFSNRTKQQLVVSYYNLKERFPNIRKPKKIYKNGFYHGYFILGEGTLD